MNLSDLADRFSTEELAKLFRPEPKRSQSVQREDSRGLWLVSGCPSTKPSVTKARSRMEVF